MAERDTSTAVGHPDCPKAMVFGPCGGVGSRGSCEVDGRACPFPAEEALRSWPVSGLLPRPFGLPAVIVDVRPDVDRPDLLRSMADRLVAHGCAALLGEHLDDPDPEHPHRAARRVTGLGVATVATVTPRNRSVDECGQEVDELRAAGVLAVHCVTGDHPAARFGGGLGATFPMDGTRLTALARERGAFVTVAESPAHLNLSGSASGHGTADRIEIMTEVAVEVAVEVADEVAVEVAHPEA
jgi:methylenetetrahydrofolate reductase (NADPH)